MAENDEVDDPIESYVRRYAGSYSPESIRMQLLTAGHDPARIDAALARAFERRNTVGRKVVKALGIAGIVFVVILVLAFGACLLMLVGQGHF